MQYTAVRALRNASITYFERRVCVLSRYFSISPSASQVGRVVPVLLSDIGEGIAEVEVLRWFTSKGSAVRQFDPLVEVQSDKATVEITSRYNGVVDELVYEPGDIAPVGKPLCYIRTEEAALPEVLDTSRGALENRRDHESTLSSDATLGSKNLKSADNQGLTQCGAQPLVESQPVSTKPVTVPTSITETRALAIPAVRRLATEHGLALDSVQGTGKDGRVTKEDVYRHLGLSQEQPADAKLAQSEKRIGPDQWISRGSQSQTAASVEVVKIRGLMRAMVKSMTASAAIPHLGLGEEVNMDALYQLRQQLKPTLEKLGMRLTYLPFFIKATSLALTDFPLLNASVDEQCEHVMYHKSHNISIAMDTSEGLVTPNVKHVEQLTIAGIANELTRLGREAERGRFSQDDLAGGTFALSNIGSIGGTYTSPRVVSGQVAIGALGRMRRIPVVKDGDDSVSIGRVLHVSWSADHRVVDGATIANFSNAWKRYVENPALMLLHLK